MFLALLGIFFSAATAQAEPGVLNLLSYNIWGLPKVAGGKAYWRFEEIGKHLDPYDIVSIQEAWDPATEALPQAANFPYVARGNDIHKLTGGSGIMILSRHPIVETATLTYDTCAGSDCLAKKGALRARVQLPNGQLLDIYDTHMNAWLQIPGLDIGAAIRSRQIAQLAAWIHEQSVGVPFLVMCDSNSLDLSVNYFQMEQLFKATDVYRSVHPLGTLNGDGDSYDGRVNTWIPQLFTLVMKPMRIDYIWASPEFETQDFEQSNLVFNQAAPQGNFLSDHFGLEARIRLK